MQQSPLLKEFCEMFSRLRVYQISDQNLKIMTMNQLLDSFEDNELRTVLTKEVFDELYEIVTCKKLSMKNLILLLKHMGYCKALRGLRISGFKKSALSNCFSELIENDEKNGKIKLDLCECYCLLYDYGVGYVPHKICVPCPMKVAINKEESEKAQKDVEDALLALSSIGHFVKVQTDYYLNEITNIIKYHQEHNNLTQLAYQSAWGFLINRYYHERKLEGLILNELHFMREATQELENLERFVNWTTKEKSEKEWKKVLTIKRWMKTLHIFYKIYHNRREEIVGLFRCTARICKEANGFHSDVVLKNIIIITDMVTMGKMNIDDFLRAGAVDFIASGMNQLTLESVVLRCCLFLISEYKKKLSIIKNCENDKNRWKMLSRVLDEKLEEGGFFDIPVVYFGKGIFE